MDHAHGSATTLPQKRQVRGEAFEALKLHSTGWRGVDSTCQLVSRNYAVQERCQAERLDLLGQRKGACTDE